MLGLVLVNGRFWISKANALAEFFDVVGFARQKSPARPGAERLPVMLDYVHGILFGLQSERVHENIPANLISQQLLDLRQIGNHRGTNLVALGKEEVERN